MSTVPTASPGVTQSDDPDFTGAQGPLLLSDWDVLFNAVTARLRDIAGTLVDMAAAPPALAGMPQRARSKLMECAEALDQLHVTMSQQQVLQHAPPRMLQDAPQDMLQDTPQDTLHETLHDTLTALPNRAHFREVLARALTMTGQPFASPRLNPYPNQRSSLALMVLDLDGFKPINDQHGRAVGDGMLRIVAARLARAVRAGDCVGRVGGDEFACMLGGIGDRQQLSHLACKLFDAVSAPLQIGKLQLTLRPSIGIAICPTDGGTAETLLARADAAMVRAKREQSGYAFFERRADLTI